MSLEETIAEAIITAVEELGGNPRDAVDAATRCRNVDEWLNQETTKLALAGGAEMIIPGLHTLTIPVGISYLIHKLAHISWGIGALKGTYVIETSEHSDLRNILTLWANDSHFNASLLEHLALSADSVDYALSKDGQKAIKKLLDETQDDTLRNSLRLLQQTAKSYAGDERGQQVMMLIAGEESAQSTLESAQSLKFEEIDLPEGKPLGRKISTKLAGKLAARLASRLPAKFLVGFLPIAGAVVNAFLNAQTLQSMAEAAEKYYDRRLRVEHLTGEVA